MDHRTVLVVEDDTALREALCETLHVAGFQALSADDGEGALKLLSEQSADLVFSDVKMRPLGGHELLRRLRRLYPEVPVVMMTAFGTIERAVEAMREGAADYLVKPFAAERLVELARRLAPGRASGDSILAEDPRTLSVLHLAERIASSNATVLISGESGTGKEVFARHIHAHSSRAEGPFVAINCAAIPENMLEAMLFGHEKGAFTGAHASRAGKLEQANGGTLLLDEISEMALGLQAKLLRVLQERQVERLGGSCLIDLDVRVIATTNRALREEVSEGRFREDLFYRLNVLPLSLPPLRERPGDILPLARLFLDRFAGGARPPRSLSAAASECLERHPWPGNVRELENLIQRALVLSRTPVLEREDLCFEMDAHPPAVMEAMSGEEMPDLGGSLREREQDLILGALRECRGSRKQAAEKLGISPRTLRYKLARMRAAGIEIGGAAGGAG